MTKMDTVLTLFIWRAFKLVTLNWVSQEDMLYMAVLSEQLPPEPGQNAGQYLDTLYHAVRNR